MIYLLKPTTQYRKKKNYIRSPELYTLLYCVGNLYPLYARSTNTLNVDIN